jgi:putative transcriptional regulator
MTPPSKGCLLVASPTLEDPNFFRTVVLLLAYDDDGALGVVLNRPSDLPVAEIVPAWAVHVSPPDVVFGGGPVQPNAAICVGHPASRMAVGPGDAEPDAGSDSEPGAGFDPDPEAGFDPDLADPFGGYSPLTTSLGTVDLQREPGEIDVQLTKLRVFTGYSGWEASQLDDEIDEGAWIVLDAEPDDAFTHDPDTLWERVLRRQGGWLAALARYPLDLSLN